MILFSILVISIFFSIGRFIGSIYETEEYYRNVYPFPYSSVLDCLLKTINYSWISLVPVFGLFIGLYLYYVPSKEKYLFKWSFKGLK
jgi:hypothetical protein